MAANPKSEVPPDGTKNPDYPYHVYHAEAHVLSGHLKHPIKQPIDFEGHVVLDKTRREGHITRSTGRNQPRGIDHHTRRVIPVLRKQSSETGCLGQDSLGLGHLVDISDRRTQRF